MLRLAAFLGLLLSASPAFTAVPEIAELPGPVVIAGAGELSKDAAEAFFKLAGKAKAKIVVIAATKEKPDDLLNDPSGINVDGYGKGWLFELTGVLKGILTAEEYHAFLDEAWLQTQRLIKGQLNSTDGE